MKGKAQGIFVHLVIKLPLAALAIRAALDRLRACQFPAKVS